MFELLGLLVQSIPQVMESREQGVVDLGDGGNVHGSGEANWVSAPYQRESRKDARIVTALAHVNMIVGVYRFLRTKLSTKKFDGAV